jgi:hypothetical protein
MEDKDPIIADKLILQANAVHWYYYLNSKPYYFFCSVFYLLLLIHVLDREGFQHANVVFHSRNYVTLQACRVEKRAGLREGVR